MKRELLPNLDHQGALDYVSDFGFGLEYLSDEFRKDPTIVIAAVRENGYALQHADKELRKDPTIAFEALKNIGFAFKYAHKTLKLNRSFVLQAVKVNGFAIKHAVEFHEDYEIVLAAVRSVPSAFLYADPCFFKCRKIMYLAMRSQYIGLECRYSDSFNWLRRGLFFFRDYKMTI